MFVIAWFLFNRSLEFQIIRFMISTFTPIFFIEISFVLPPPLPQLVVLTHAYNDRVGVRYISGGIKVYYLPFRTGVRKLS